MHGSVVVCFTVNGSVKRFTGCDTSGMIITWCVRVDGLLGVSELIACLVCPCCKVWSLRSCLSMRAADARPHGIV